MKRLHLWITLVAAVPLLTGCNETESLETEHVPLNFSTVVDTPTRVTDLTTENLTSMGVFACFSQGNFNASTATPDFMYNQIVERTDAAAPWIYSPVKYWPNNVKDKISFFAYAPHNAVGVTPCIKTNKGYPYLTYTLSTEEAKQIDLLAAIPLINKDNTENSVKFNFKHALTKVNIIIKNGDKDNSAKTLNSFSLKAKQQGTLTYTASGFDWVALASVSTYTTTVSDVVLPTTQDATTTIATFYLIPDKAGASFSMKYTYYGSVEAGGATPEHTVTVTDKAFPDAPLWTAGGVVNYIITLNKEKLDIAAQVGASWGQDSSKSLRIFEPDELKLGDYYYSDGTYSDGGLRAMNGSSVVLRVAQSPVVPAGASCVGVVFYVGAGAGDDVSLYSKFGITEISGYVMARRNAARTYWASGDALSVDTPIPNITSGQTGSDMQFTGYQNILHIESIAADYANYNAFSACANFNEPRPATGASTWYLPSIGQLHTIWNYHGCQNGGLIVADNIRKISGGGMLDINRFWVSAEISATQATYWGFWNADHAVVGKNGNYFVRPILTFQVK